MRVWSHWVITHSYGSLSHVRGVWRWLEYGVVREVNLPWQCPLPFQHCARLRLDRATLNDLLIADQRGSKRLRPEVEGSLIVVVCQPAT